MKRIFLFIGFVFSLPTVSYSFPMKIAVTVDDLPGWHLVKSGNAQKTASLFASVFKQHKVPATGFVIGALASRTKDSMNALTVWSNAGLVLANHTWDHVPYDKSSTKEFWSGVARTEKLLAPFYKRYGWNRIFRFPMLNQGDIPEKETAANEYFFSTKTLLAHVSVDTSDWAFARYYDQFTETGDLTAIKNLEALYFKHIMDCVKYAEEASAAIFSKQIPQILLIHANQLNAVMLPDILKELRLQKYDFISLESVLDSPEYRPFRYKIIYQPADHFFYHMSHELKRDLPQGLDRSSYRYFKSYWEPQIKKLCMTALLSE
ncbi:MAG: hypothetical protein A2583_04695 [Bdellovibrionales bacterium RIFOXYD1_FULL_53_11]|nr:MAG: hypothetical protein A2583_04695 [Bdellovibrionales bacterium RIFOXYD1_FULL_53_11]